MVLSFQDIWLPAGMMILYNDSNSGRYGTYGEAKHTAFLALLHTQLDIDFVSPGAPSLPGVWQSFCYSTSL